MVEWHENALVAVAFGLIFGVILCYLVVTLARKRKQPAAVSRDPCNDQRKPGGVAHARDDQSDPDLREAILHALARAARLLLNARDKDSVMTSALGTLGKAVGVDRVYVFENYRDKYTPIACWPACGMNGAGQA